MNTQQARERVADTFPQPFNRRKFLEFARNLLNKFDESKAARWNATYVKDAFKPHVSRFERLGTYTSPDDEKLDVLVVHLTNESKLERTRTAIRNFVADHLKTRDEKDAALVAFVSPTEQQWRFSYVKMEYAAVETEAGRIAVETRLTPARRYSYIVGEGESCHTAQTRFLALLQDTENYPSLAQLEEAFSVEAVTKEFFTQYASLFGDIDAALQKLAAEDPVIGKEFKAKNVSTVDFSKKLMGQIVFLYFLQKKGWLGVATGQDWSTGPHDFLRRLARGDYGAYENFFNDILEPLFYDTLATDRGHEAWCKIFKCRIPFLNGGLFEPLADYDWRKTDIILPNKLFINTDRNDAGDIGTGVLDVFDRYNFTVNEAEPLEKEVAIDPEMLGKVFENLIEENRRKGLGAFYTPREIVHYMCQECLINYLDTGLNTDKEIVPRKDIVTFIYLGEQISHYEAVNAKYPIKMPAAIEKHARLIDEKLDTITVCDPAVGSGAYPVGMMTEIVRMRCALTPYFNDVHERTPYHFKRHAIQNCLYGVDIDPGAVEIAKLRLWLSLVVDEEDVKQIKPLPNLDFKMVTGNSLLGVEMTLFNEKIFRQLERLKPLYFDESVTRRKAELRKQIDGLIHQLTDGNETFDYHIYLSEVFHCKKGFDVVIANPPYLGEKGHKDVFRQIAASELGRRFYTGKMDLFYFFFHLALDLARNEGTIAFISTNYFITATGGKVLRRDLKQRATVKRMINFNEVRIFESAQGQHNMISILEKSSKPASLAKNYISKRKGFAAAEFLDAILAGRDTVAEYSEVANADLFEGDDLYIRLMGNVSTLNDMASMVLNKLRSRGTNLGSLCNINCGIQTGCDRMKVDGEYQGVFVLDGSETRGIPACERKLLKPFFKNSDIKRYYCSPTTPLRVIYTDRSFSRSSDYPAIIAHLAKFRNRLNNIREVKNGIIKYYQLQWPRDENIFKAAKIVAPQRSRRNAFAFNEQLWYASVDVYYLTQKLPGISLKYVLALLNSTLLYFWLYRQGKRKGEMLELYQKPLSEIPIKHISPDEQKPFIKLADRILAAKHRDAEADTIVLEREVDELVYALYGLTPEQKALVQASAK